MKTLLEDLCEEPWVKRADQDSGSRTLALRVATATLTKHRWKRDSDHRLRRQRGRQAEKCLFGGIGQTLKSQTRARSVHVRCRTLLGCLGFGLMLMKMSSCSMSAVMHRGSTSTSSLMSNISTRGRQPCGTQLLVS